MPYKNIEDRREYERMYWRNHKEESARKERTLRRRKSPQVKERVITFYGGGVAACVRCGFTDMRALTIDHIFNDGYKLREFQGNGKSLYYWLERNHYPDGYQTLCMNCQFIKKVESGKKNWNERP